MVWRGSEGGLKGWRGGVTDEKGEVQEKGGSGPPDPPPLDTPMHCIFNRDRSLLSTNVFYNKLGANLRLF